MGEDVVLLRFCPLISKRQELVEEGLIDHGREGSRGGTSRKQQKRKRSREGKRKEIWLVRADLSLGLRFVNGAEMANVIAYV